VAVFVVGDDEAVGGYAFVTDGISMLGPGRGGCLEDEVAAVLRESDGLVVLADGENGHAFAGAASCGEVEEELRGAGTKEDGYNGGAADAVAVVVEGEGKVIMLDVNDGIV
jgi:hypothetical protein